mmetsp:Transcript_127573/g.367026  ORF Transcript_127573/g.367026 Transcript_127573/m.367026 type:complete len:242 (+) Transcript_127573:794-1519(+)
MTCSLEAKVSKKPITLPEKLIRSNICTSFIAFAHLALMILMATPRALSPSSSAARSLLRSPQCAARRLRKRGAQASGMSNSKWRPAPSIARVFTRRPPVRMPAPLFCTLAFGGDSAPLDMANGTPRSPEAASDNPAAPCRSYPLIAGELSCPCGPAARPSMPCNKRAACKACRTIGKAPRAPSSSNAPCSSAAASPVRAPEAPWRNARQATSKANIAGGPARHPAPEGIAASAPLRFGYEA